MDFEIFFSSFFLLVCSDAPTTDIPDDHYLKVTRRKPVKVGNTHLNSETIEPNLPLFFIVAAKQYERETLCN